MAKFTMDWEQKSVTFNFEGEAGTPVDLLAVAGPEGREMLLEVLCINYSEEVEQMIETTWLNPVRRPKGPGSTGP